MGDIWDRNQNNKKWKISMFLHKIICCGCVLESPQRGDSNTHPKDMILRRTYDTNTGLLWKLYEYRDVHVMRGYPFFLNMAFISSSKVENIYISWVANSLFIIYNQFNKERQISIFTSYLSFPAQPHAPWHLNITLTCLYVIYCSFHCCKTAIFTAVFV